MLYAYPESSSQGVRLGAPVPMAIMNLSILDNRIMQDGLRFAYELKKLFCFLTDSSNNMISPVKQVLKNAAPDHTILMSGLQTGGQKMQETELTPAAREAIRSYMLRVVALPGVALTIAGFLVGFLVNDVARKSAYHEAYSEAAAKILLIYEQAAKAEVRTELAENKIKDLLENAKKITDEADTIRGQLRTAEAFQKSEDIVREVAAILAKRQDITKLIAGDLEKLEKRCDDLEKTSVKANKLYHIQVPGKGELVVRGGVYKNAAEIVFAATTARKEAWQFVPGTP